MYTRRKVAKLTLAALPGIVLLPRRALAQSKPNSVINGVHLGVITYSYRSMPDQGGEATLRYIVDSGISEIEMMNGPAEAFAGAPRAAGRGGGGGGRGRGQQLSPEQLAAQQAAQREAAERLKQWRLSVSMDRSRRCARCTTTRASRLRGKA